MAKFFFSNQGILRKHGLILAIFAAGCTLLIALVHQLTEQRIIRQVQQQQNTLFAEVLAGIHYDANLAQHCILVQNPQLGTGNQHIYLAWHNEKPVAAVMQVTAPDGYSGAIQLLVGADFSGTILGVRVTEHHETPGLGDKIELRASNWISQFAGKHIVSADDPRWAVKKDGGEIDQFTGATITPRAVVNAVKRAVLFAETLPAQLDHFTTCEQQKP